MEISIIILACFIILLLGLVVYFAIKAGTFSLNKQTAQLKKELKHEHTKLTELQLVLSSFFNHSSTGLIITNEEGDIIHSNEASKKLINVNSNLDGKNFKELEVYEKNTEIVNAFYKAIIYPVRKTEVTIVEEDKIREKHVYYQFINLNTIRRNMILIIITDITAFVNSKLSDVKMESYNQLFATLSHYLNNTMTIMGLAVQKYKMGDEKDYNKLGQFVDFTTQKISFILKAIEEKIHNKEIEHNDYIGSKNLLIDLESSIKEFEENTRKKFDLLSQNKENN